jgi:hypothetical protein
MVGTAQILGRDYHARSDSNLRDRAEGILSGDVGCATEELGWRCRVSSLGEKDRGMPVPEQPMSTDFDEMVDGMEPATPRRPEVEEIPVPKKAPEEAPAK